MQIDIHEGAVVRLLQQSTSHLQDPVVRLGEPGLVVETRQLPEDGERMLLVRFKGRRFPRLTPQSAVAEVFMTPAEKARWHSRWRTAR
jgi:hypothetical protein